MKIADYIAATMGEHQLRERHGITPTLYRYYELYTRYSAMLAAGEKKAYIYAKLAEAYALHPRNVRKILKAIEKEI
jgi:hypothetical protein